MGFAASQQRNGWLAASLPVFLKVVEPDSAGLINMQILCGIVAVTGHIFPIFANFKGGKGVAAIFGVLLAIHPFLTLSCVAVFLVVLLLTGIVSVASMTAGIMFPVFLLTVFNTPSLFFKIFSVLVSVGLLITHRKNIKRLIAGEEPRLIGKRKNKTS